MKPTRFPCKGKCDGRLRNLNYLAGDRYCRNCATTYKFQEGAAPITKCLCCGGPLRRGPRGRRAKFQEALRQKREASE